MSDEKKNIPRSQSNTNSSPEPERIRKQAEQKAKAMTLSDLGIMTPEEIHHMIHDLQVKQIEAELQNEQLRSQLEKRDDQAALFRIVTENMLDMVALTDMEGNFTFAGKSHENLGYEPGYLIGKNVMDFVHPEDRTRILAEFSEFVASGHPRKVEYRNRCKDGTHIWLETIGNFIKDENGIHQEIVFSSRDITERKQAENALEHAYDLMRYIIEHANSAVAVHDRDLNYIYASQQYLDQFRVKETDVIGRHHYDVFPDLPQKWRDVHQKVLAGEVFCREKDSYPREDGTLDWTRWECRPWYEADGTIGGIIVYTEIITERVAAEQALRQSENYYRAIFETSGTAIFILEKDTTISLVNMYSEELTGYSRQEIEGKKSWTEFVHPDDVDWMKENHYLRRQNSNAAPRQYEYRFITRHGEMRYILLGVDIIPETDQSIASCIDITERKKAEEALTRQLRFEQAAAAASTCLLSSEISEASMTDALFPLLEASGVSRVYIFENFNDSDDGLCMRQIFEVCAPGVPSEIDNSFLQHLPYSQGFERWREILSQGNAIQGDVCHFPYAERNILESQEIISILALPIFVEGQWSGFIGFDETRQPRNWVDMEVALLRTVAEMLGGFFARKQSGKALAASERRFREILQNVATVAVQGYAMDGTVLYWNRASETFYGYTAEEAFGRNLLDLIIPPEKCDEVRDEILHMADTGEAMPASELWLMRKDGSRIPVYSSHALVQVPGQYPELYCIDIDLTDRLRAEAEKERLQAQLSQAQKMESVGRLAGGVAHDFNNKLAIINGYAEMAIDMIDTSDPIRETIQEIYTAGNQSALIVRQLLAFARKQTISPVQLDLNDTISSMLKMLQRLIGENINLAWHPGNNLWPVKIDPSQVDQVMANLAVNSRDAISDVGKLTIETKNTIVDEDYCESNPEAIPGRYIMLAVSDDGCGIEEEVKEQLFDPYFTTKEIGKGTGLGLPTVYGIVKQNNGFINVYSEPGEGTTFKLYFPSHEEANSSLHSAKKSSEQIPTGTETVLVVEDENMILQMSKQMLERLGYTVETATSPAEVLQISNEYNRTINLLITDVVMPEMNGRDLSARLSKNHPDLKTLYMSGYTANVIAHHGVLDEGVQFIQKPFSLKDLATKVREVLEQE